MSNVINQSKLERVKKRVVRVKGIVCKRESVKREREKVLRAHLKIQIEMRKSSYSKEK